MALIPHLYDFERPIRMMERDFFRPDDLFKQLVPGDFFASPFFKPWEHAVRPWENYLKPIGELSSVMNRLALSGSTINSDDQKFQVNVDVQHFTPEEINVKVVNGQVIIEGNHEEKRDEHGYVSRQFVRKYSLPHGCLPETVESKLSSDGVLTVTAPKVLPLPSPGERIVPISHTGPVKKQLGSPQVTHELKAEG